MRRILALSMALLLLLVLATGCLQSSNEDDAQEEDLDSQLAQEVSPEKQIVEVQSDERPNVRRTVETEDIFEEPNQEPEDDYDEEPEEYYSEDIEAFLTPEDLIEEIEQGSPNNIPRSYAYLVNQNDDKVQIVETYIKQDFFRTDIVGEIEVGLEPQKIVLGKGKRYAFVVNAGVNSVSVIELDKREVITSFETREFPRAISISQDGEELYLGSTNFVEIFDISNVHDISLIEKYRWPQSPLNIVEAPDGKFFYATSPDSETLVVFDLELGRITKEIHLEGYPEFLAIDQARKQLYVAGTRSGVLTVIDLNNYEILNEVELGRAARPAAMKFGPRGNLYITQFGTNDLAIYNPISEQVFSKVPLGKGPKDLAFEKGYLYVTHMSDNFLAVIDLEDYTIKDKINLGEYTISSIVFR